jgi:hypothetical protein
MLQGQAKAELPPMQCIDDNRDRADDRRDVRKNPPASAECADCAARPSSKGDRWFRARRKTSLSVFVFSCAHGASLSDSCAIIFHKPLLDNIPIG